MQNARYGINIKKKYEILNEYIAIWSKYEKII